MGTCTYSILWNGSWILGQLVWDRAPVNEKRNISVIPYLLGDAHKDFEIKGTLKQSFAFGMDAKIALNSNLNLDLTVNPDFSQVDVDEQQTNLTTVNLRFPERRLFFWRIVIFSAISEQMLNPFLVVK